MVEVSIRIFFPKRETGFLPDYHDQMAMIREQMAGEVKAGLDETEGVQIWQYYSIAPLGWLEARYLRRMGLGKSVMCVAEGIGEYIEGKHMPRMMGELLSRYLRLYLNSLDYIVVGDALVEQMLKKEGIRKPRFCRIPLPGENRDFSGAAQWLKLYRKMAADTV